jgi:ribosomal subunit interface protein
MDIKIVRDSSDAQHSFEKYAQNRCKKYFDKYNFIQSIQVFLRGQKHPTKKVKLHVRLKGKEIFASASGDQHHDAFDNALLKLSKQLRKYKTFRYKAA